jgi:hypothetical protein
MSKKPRRTPSLEEAFFVATTAQSKIVIAWRAIGTLYL